MEFKYLEENIPNAIATAIVEYEAQSKKRAHYNEIYRRIENLLGHRISEWKLQKNLTNMVNAELLIRHDPTGRRGSRVHFWLTEKCKRKYVLKILGSGVDVERRKRLYSLLIFFEIYKRRPLLTERQLSRLLKEVGSSIIDFRRSRELIPGTLYKSLRGVEILGISKYDPITKSNKMWYYTVIPGFSIEEFIAYQKALKSGREPRPFLSSPTIVPFALLESYTKKEVKEEVVSLKEAGLIEPIEPVFPGEKRYNIVDKSVRGLIRIIWSVRMIDFELLSIKLLYSRPTDLDKKYLETYISQGFADRIIVHAHDIRRSKKEERKIRERPIRELEEHRRHLVQEITSKYDKVIHENEVVCDIVEEICHPSLKTLIDPNTSGGRG